MPEASIGIPARLLARLLALRNTLSVRGSLHRRTEPDREAGWRLRFRERGEAGEWHNRSIPLGDGAVAQVVRELMGRWQQEERNRRHAERERVAEQHRQNRQRRELRRACQQMAGGGRRRRQRATRAFDRAWQQGPAAGMLFVMTRGYAIAPAKPGRPHKGGLVVPSPRGTTAPTLTRVPGKSDPRHASGQFPEDQEP